MNQYNFLSHRLIIGLSIFSLLFVMLSCGKGSPTEPSLSDQNVTGNNTEIKDNLESAGSAYEVNVPQDRAPYAEGEVQVVFYDPGQISTGTLESAYPLELIRKIPLRWGTIFHMKITDGTPVPEMVSILRQDPDVRFAEPNNAYYFAEAPYFPNDPLYERDDEGNDPRDNMYDQWGPSHVGANIVWNEQKGSSDVIVAIIDTGIRRTHEDLVDRIWINEDEIPDNAIDDDNNGYVDDTWGWNLAGHNNNPADNGVAGYHGSACSGVVAATQDNNLGLTGMAPGVRLMALSTSFGAAWETEITEGVNYAAMNGAEIVSMSFGGAQQSEIMETAMNDAWDGGHGINLIAAAHNYNSTSYIYPAAYDAVMSIAATICFTSNGSPIDEHKITAGQDGYGWGSNYGDWIHVSAYGERYTTVHGGGDDQYKDGYNHGFFGGTSNATPMTAGTMALIHSQFPGMSAEWYWSRMQNTVDDLGDPGFDILTGWGRINPVRALYGSDRFTGLEDPDGFVGMVLPDAEMYDTIHDFPGNPFNDTYDLYKVTVNQEGFLNIYLDIFTWGEDLDLEVYSDPQMTDLIGSSYDENHATNSFESIGFADAKPGEEYFIKVLSSGEGSSTTYGLRTRMYTNELVVTGESIAPPFVHQTGNKVPFLKLNVHCGFQATLDGLNISKHGTTPDEVLSQVYIYQDANQNGGFDQADQLLMQATPPSLNRVRFENMNKFFDIDHDLVLFVVADFSLSPDDTTISLSLESYKDVITEEGLVAHYAGFPIRSDDVLIGTDSEPPYWLTTTGAQTTEPFYHSVTVGWNEADDLLTPPVKYNIYYSTEFPSDISAMQSILDASYVAGDTTDYEYELKSLPAGDEHFFVLRAEDQVGNEDQNFDVISGIPGDNGDPANPQIINSFFVSGIYQFDVDGDIMAVARLNSGVYTYILDEPTVPQWQGSWFGDTAYNVTVNGDYIYVGGSTNVNVLDVTDPANPVLTDSAANTFNWRTDFADSWIYTVNSSGQLFPVDASDPDNLIDYPLVDPPGFGFTSDLLCTTDAIYNIGQNSIYAIARTDPSAPVFTTEFGNANSYGLYAYGDYLISNEWGSGTLNIWDISVNPLNPALTGSTTDGPGASNFNCVVVGGYAYTTKSDFGLVVYDISDPSNPTYTGELAIAGASYIRAHGDLIYVMGNNSMLYVIV